MSKSGGLPAVLRLARQAARLSQTEAALAIGKSRQTLGSYERDGGTTPDDATLEALRITYRKPLGWPGTELGGGSTPVGTREALPRKAHAAVLRISAALVEWGASDGELEYARSLLLKPDRYGYNFDGTRREMTEAEQIEEIEAIGAVLPRLIAEHRVRRGIPLPPGVSSEGWPRE